MFLTGCTGAAFMLATCQYSASITWTAEKTTHVDCKWNGIWTGSDSD